MAKGRSAKVIMTPEAKALRRLRERSGLSMREAGEALGYSASYISQIENGRENSPQGEKLLKFLKVYGDITPKYFAQLAKEWAAEVSDVDLLIEHIRKLRSDQLKMVRSMVESLLKT